MLNKSATGLIVGALVLCAVAPVSAGQRAKKEADTSAALDRSPVRCLWLPRLGDSKVVDDQTILFYTRGGGVYRNVLDQKCPGLGRSGRFAYEVRESQLCDSDSVTVLEDQFAPGVDSIGGLHRGLTCRLGKFYPITALEAKDMLAGPKGALAERNEIDVKVVKLPRQDTNAATKDGQSAAAGKGGSDQADAQNVKDDKTSEPSRGDADQQD